MKVYRLHNYDGVNEAMVAAPNLAEAARRLGTSVYHMRQMGWDHPPPDLARLAIMAEGTALFRPIDARRESHPWRSKRYHRSRFGGWE